MSQRQKRQKQEQPPSSQQLVTGNNNSNVTETSKSIQSCEQLRHVLARQLDSRICNFGGSISAEWNYIKSFVAGEIQTNLADAVRGDVECLLEHPQLRELVRKLRAGRADSETQADVLDKMTASILPKVRRNHQEFLDRLNQQVSQMIVQLMRNDQLAVIIDDDTILHHLFRLASSDEDSSLRT